MGNKYACCGILCYVQLVQRALFVCMTIQASLVKMRRLYEVKTNCQSKHARPRSYARLLFSYYYCQEGPLCKSIYQK